MAYASYNDVEIRIGREFSEIERHSCESYLESAALIIDSYSAASDKPADVKKEVSVNMVSKVMADTSSDIPIGASQGSMSGLGYSQSWTISNGAAKTLYLDKYDKRLLGIGNIIGSHSPLEDMEG